MELLKFIETIRTPFLDTVFGLVTRFGEQEIAILLFCIIYWCINKRMAYGIGIAFFLSGITVQGLKVIFRIDRPWILDPSLNPVPSALKHATGYSFPSGHTQCAASVFGSLGTLIKQKHIKITCLLLVFLVAFSRLYLGVHTLLDVTTSILLSILFILLAVKLSKFEPTNKKRELFIFLCMTGFAILVIAAGSVLYSKNIIEQEYLSDLLKAAGAAIGFAAGMYIERIYIGFSVRSKNILLQIIKFIIGFAGVYAILSGLKIIMGAGLAVDTIRYILLMLWMTSLYPLIIKRFFAL